MEAKVEPKFKVGDKVRILYAGSQFWAEGMTATIIPNDYDKYDCRAEVDIPSKTQLYFFNEDLEKL